MSNSMVPAARAGTRSTSRQLAKQIRAIDEVAIRKARKIEGAAFVAFVGSHHVTWISELERRLVQQVPHAEPRLMPIGDALAVLVAGEITSMMWEG